MSGSGPDVIIVGGGVAGLTCARSLAAAGRHPLVLEAGDAVGGRVRTDIVDGFLLDRGFQVLLTAYPEAKRLLDYDALELKEFRPGARVRLGGAFRTVSDPIREPSTALATMRSPVGSLGDKLKIARIRGRCGAGSIEDQLGGPDVSTASQLQGWGMSDDMIHRFFRPFLGGIFLDADLETTARMFRFVFRMFAQGTAALPARGMGQIPEQLAAGLPPGTVRLGARVHEVRDREVILESGETLAAPDVVIATDGESAAGIAGSRSVEWKSVDCLYYAAEAPPLDGAVLVLNGEDGPINNLCIPTEVSPDYGPSDRALISVSVLGHEGGANEVEAAVRTQLVDWFGAEATDWDHLRTYRIRRALPAQPPGWLEPPQRDVRLGGQYVIGDHTSTASLNGAMQSGRLAAEAIVEAGG